MAKNGYEYWRGWIGSTVRIKQGAFAGTVGRLGMVTDAAGNIFYPERDEGIWVIYADLELVTPTEERSDEQAN